MTKLKLARTSVDQDAGSISFTWSNGRCSGFNMDDLPDHIVRTAALMEIRRKLTDCYAAAGNEKDPLGFALDAQAQVWAAMVDGNWSRTGESREEREIRAFAIIAKIEDADEARDRWSEFDEAKLKAIRLHSAFRNAYKALLPKRLPKKAKDEPSLEDLIG